MEHLESLQYLVVEMRRQSSIRKYSERYTAYFIVQCQPWMIKKVITIIYRVSSHLRAWISSSISSSTWSRQLSSRRRKSWWPSSSSLSAPRNNFCCPCLIWWRASFSRAHPRLRRIRPSNSYYPDREWCSRFLRISARRTRPLCLTCARGYARLSWRSWVPHMTQSSGGVYRNSLHRFSHWRIPRGWIDRATLTSRMSLSSSQWKRLRSRL